MIKIRLAKMGRKHHPVFKIVAADARCPRDGRYIESLGVYNPHAKEDSQILFNLKAESIRNWLNKGAHLTDTVNTILKKHKIQY